MASALEAHELAQVFGRALADGIGKGRRSTDP